LRAGATLVGPDVSGQAKELVSAQDLQQLQALNHLVEQATQDALNAGCLAVQTMLGVSSGDEAGVFFSGPVAVRPVAQAIADYIGHEIAVAATTK
jgi:hypothetical protein